jgi:hypothetical protein
MEGLDNTRQGLAKKRFLTICRIRSMGIKQCLCVQSLLKRAILSKKWSKMMMASDLIGHLSRTKIARILEEITQQRKMITQIKMHCRKSRIITRCPMPQLS